MFGGTGNDTVLGANAGATIDLIIETNEGNDNITTAGGDDTVTNTQGNDTIAAAAGNNNISAVAISSKGFESKLEPYIKKILKFNYAPNWADDLDMDMDPIALSKNQKIHFTFAGNVGKVQNLENIINAFYLLPGNYQKKSQLNIIGDGSNLIFLKKLSNNNPNIIFHGKPMREDMAIFYKASDFIILPSKHEGFGYSLAEGAAYGSIPLASNVDGPRDIIIHGYSGYLINIKSISKYVKYIRSLGGNQKLKKLFSYRAYLSVKKYNQDIYIKHYQKYFETLLEN